MSQLELEDAGKVVLDQLIRIREERDAWKEAFLATRAYYSNNNGPNVTRRRAAIKQLKEMKLIK